MTEATTPDIRDLILALDKKIDTQFRDLDKKLDAMDKKIDVQNSELKSEIQRVELSLEKQISLNGAEIKRLEEKMDGFGKRLDQQEFISRGAIITLLAGVATGFIRYLFFPG
jgi:hypothetical protein